MKINRNIIIASTLIIATMMSSCGKVEDTKNAQNLENKETTSQSNDEYYPVQITNYNDNVIDNKRALETFTYESEPTKVVLVDQSMTDIMIELGLTKNIVGISNITNEIDEKYADVYAQLPVLGSFDKTAISVNDLGFPTKEMVVMSSPDMIIGWSGLFYEDSIGTVKEWNDKGVHTFMVRNVADMESDKNVQNLFNDILDLGTIFNVQDKSEELVKQMQNTLDEVQSNVSGVTKKVTVLPIGLSNENTYQVYGKGTLMADLVEKAGGEVIATGRSTITNENLIELNPDVILYLDYASDINTDEEGIEFFESKSVLQTVNAVKNKKIIVSPFTRSFAGNLDTANEVKRFSEIFYPELYTK